MLTRDDPQARRLATILRLGVINVTGLLAAVGDGSAFAKGRDLAAWLSLTPRQSSSGGKTKLLGSCLGPSGFSGASKSVASHETSLGLKRPVPARDSPNSLMMHVPFMTLLRELRSANCPMWSSLKSGNSGIMGQHGVLAVAT